MKMQAKTFNWIIWTYPSFMYLWPIFNNNLSDSTDGLEVFE